MARYQIVIDNEDAGAEGGDWCAALFEELEDGSTGDMITSGVGYTAREAVADLDWHHDWTDYLIERED